MNILIMRMDAIGDVVHVLPALNAIKKQYPHAHITFLVSEAASGIIQGHRAVERVIVYRKFSLFSTEGLKKHLLLIAKLKSYKYDLIIDFHALFRNNALIGISSVEGKIGYNRGKRYSLRQILLNTKVPIIGINQHATAKSMKFLDSLGIRADKVEYHLPIYRQNRSQAKELLLKNGLKKSEILVGISPVASWETKCWGNERYSRLAERLITEYGADIAFTGSSLDYSVIEDIAQSMNGKSTNIAGKVSLMTFAALCESFDLFISGDTGPAQVAAAVGTPVVSIFGPTAPWRFRPLGPDCQILWAGLECSPCFKHYYSECLTQDCMKKISIEHVLCRVKLILRAHKNNARRNKRVWSQRLKQKGRYQPLTLDE